LQVSQRTTTLAGVISTGQITSLAAKEAQQRAKEAEIRLLGITYAAKKTAIALQKLVNCEF